MPAVETFYEAAIAPELWGKALNQACAVWGADGAIVSSYPDCTGGLLYSDGLEEFCTRFIDEGWNKRDVRSQRGIPMVCKGKEIVTDPDLFTTDELRQIPFYSQFLPAVGFGWFAGTVLSEAGGAKVTLSLHRRAYREPFTRSDLASFPRDLPHVQRAARLASRVRLSYAEGFVDSLERFTCGAILIDWLGRVLRTNARAESYLSDDLQIASLRLRSSQREVNRSLHDLVEACTRPIGEGGDLRPSSILIPRSRDIPLLLQSYPLVRTSHDVFQSARGLLLIIDPAENRTLALSIVQEIFRLTPAELRVDSDLFRGLDTQQIAANHQIGTQTVRYHLKSIFAKTGTNHQAGLVSLLSRFSERT